MRKVRVAITIGLLCAAAACSHDTTPVGAQRSSGPAIVPIPAVEAVGPPTPANPFALFVEAADGVLVANPDITPGHVPPGTTAALVCTPGYGLDLRHPDYGTRAAVFAQYGVPWSAHKQYQLDDLIPVILGGDSSKTNLWPMPLVGLATPARKAALAEQLHTLVCANKLPLSAAQTAIAANWWVAYQKYGQPAPVPQEVAKAICSPLGARAQTEEGKPLACSVAGNKLRWMVASPSPAPSTPTAGGQKIASPSPGGHL